MISVLRRAVRPNLLTVCDVLWHPVGIHIFMHYSSSRVTLCAVRSRMSNLRPLFRQLSGYGLSDPSTFTAHIFYHSGHAGRAVSLFNFHISPGTEAFQYNTLPMSLHALRKPNLPPTGDEVSPL